MPTTNNQYYPALSDLITTNDLPDFLGFIKDELENVFDKLYVKDYQVYKSLSGSSAFYSLSIISRKKLAIELPGTGILFVLNPDYDDTLISSFPITVFWQWEVLRYIRYFNLNNFSFSPQDFYNLTLEILNINEEEAINLAINTFVVQSNPSLSRFSQLVFDINTLYGSTIVIDETSPEKIEQLIIEVEQLNQKIFPTVFALYILDTGLSETKLKVNRFFASFVPHDVEEYIKNIIIPQARITLELSAAIEFPRKLLVPWLNGAPNPDLDVIARFQFAQAILYADTQAGIGYNLELSGTLDPQYCEIGNTGILIQIESLKLDLSKKTNIPEADADGRPEDFTGVYARALSVTLPARWFHDDAVQGTPATTLRIGGYDLLIGTGGVSGTFMLETVPSIITGEDPYYFEDKFEIVFPVVVFEKNESTNVIEEVTISEVEGLTLLKLKLFPPNNTSIAPCSLKFPITVNLLPISTGETLTFDTITSYQEFLNSFSPPDTPPDTVPTFWKKIGSADKGFRVGFNRFDISLKQNKVVSSNIKGKLEIEKFVYPQDAVDENNVPIPYPTKVLINIDGHLSDNGDFNLTASAAPPYPIEFPEVFTYRLKSVELGKEDDDFYIGTSGTLQFEGFLKDVLNLGPIEIERLRIYSDGTIEFVGGSINLIDPIELFLGPVTITVTAIHYGSHQKEVNGVMRKFNYFGFDGGVSIDPLGIEVRGDGVKYYYCVDDIEGHDKPKPYLHIQTLHLDLTIPASSGALAQINGWVTIPEPGISKEYAGGITLQIPSINLAGKADIKLMPKYPAFIIDCELEPPVPIPLGSFAIYGFRGLLGYRYVAEKEAIGMVSGVNTWYEYYKAPKRGINVHKFSGPDKSINSSTPFSLGAGATLGTSSDDGYTFSLKAMALFSIPSLFMIDGRANILAKRLGLDDTTDPPFFAFVAVGDDSLELGFGADYAMPGSGMLLSLYADVQAGFFFKNQQPWYINIGTAVNPVTARLITLLTIKSYVMLSAKGIEAGARGEFDFDRDYGVIKVQAHAFVEVGGKISFERPQMGSYLMAGVTANIKVLFVTLSLDVGILFGVEAPKPFLIYGKFYFKVKVGIKIFGKRITLFKFSGDLEVVWNLNKNVDRTPINPLLVSIEDPNNLSEYQIAILDELVKGIHMLTNEPFSLGYLATPPTGAPDEAILNYILPLDTYIDIKTQKGLLPGNVQDPNNSVRKLIGGVNNAPSQYVDLIPPISSIKGRSIRQVKHQYTLDHLEIKFWNITKGIWEDYHPYEALYPDDVNISNLKIGHFQKTDGMYNAVRILGTTPFSYTEQGEPGWYIPEQYGINASTLFCAAEKRKIECTNFLMKPLNAHYYCGNPNTPFFSNDVSFQLISSNEGDYAFITDEPNTFDITKSLAFDNWNSMEILLPQPTAMTRLRVSNFTGGVKIKFYSIIQSVDNDEQFNVVYGNPDPEVSNINDPFEIVLYGEALQDDIKYNFTNIPEEEDEWQIINSDWRPITRIVVEPIFDSSISQQIASLIEQIATIENNNSLILLEIIEGDILSTTSLEADLNQLICGSSEGSSIGCGPEDSVLCELYDFIQEVFQNSLINPSLVSETDFDFVSLCYTEIYNQIRSIDNSYNLLINLSSEIQLINDFLNDESLESYLGAWNAVQSILTYLNEIGNCDCHCEPKEFTVIHQVCWLSVEDYEYNINIPSQEDIALDAQATIAGLTEYIQPIWRPDTSYYIRFVLKDTIDNGAQVKPYDYTYGFTTAGPVGYFHIAEKATYGDLKLKVGDRLLKDDNSYFIVAVNGLLNQDESLYVASTNGFVLEDTTGYLRDAITNDLIIEPGSNPTRNLRVVAHPDNYSLTSLKQYIDYNRSYPNADGNLLHAKPLFYNDEIGETTQIYLFFNKAYATHFFHTWESYKIAEGGSGLPLEDEDLPLDNAIAGRLKIVIKDPVEDISIVNPPYLDYDEDDIVYTHIPQTEEVWIAEENPQVPFAISNYLNLFNVPNCVGEVTIIKPASEFVTITPKHLKPNKLYTVLVNNLFDVNHNGVFENTAGIEETREVHKFVFKTSRYKDFKQQINSYFLKQEIEGQLVQREAKFNFEKQFTLGEINACYDTIVGLPISGISSEEIETLLINYQHPYDRVFEGILGLKPWNEAISTEINIIKDTVTGTIIALIVRNPEPFNNPKFRKEVMADTIEVLTNGVPDASYNVLLSKDHSQAILMNSSKSITENLSLHFKYKIYDDSFPGDNVIFNYPVKDEEVLLVDLLNN